MLTKVVIRNFKLFADVGVELGNRVVFIGPNNSGKTTALQALALWDIGLRRWVEKRGKGKKTPEKRSGVTINRTHLIAVPVPDANLLWRDLHVRDVQRVDGEQQTRNIRVDIIVEGVSHGKPWKCGLEFDYANAESFYCRPLRLTEGKNPDRMPIPNECLDVQMAYLPPMSGLAANETKLDPGAVNVRLGEGRTAEVLRNLCYQIVSGEDGAERWSIVCNRIKELFGEALDAPRYIPERGEIVMTYRTRSGTRLDLSSSGRGLQQTLLLLAHLRVNSRSVLLLDEPDAHLEILRQREIYQVLTETAREQESQIIAASHSEVILNEAAGRDVVVAFLGEPHRIDNRGSQVLKSLKDIGFEDYYQAEQKGWVLYLEGSTDLSILSAFAEKLDHPIQVFLKQPFVHYVLNLPQTARTHFHGLREARQNIVGFALYDKIDRQLQDADGLTERMWNKQEIENYLCKREVLLRWAQDAAVEYAGGPIFSSQWESTMVETITEVEQAMQTLDKGSPWDPKTKVTDDFLDPLFSKFFDKLDLPNLMRKSQYHVLARHLAADEIDPEVPAMLDLILEVANRAVPAPEGPSGDEEKN